MNELVRLTVRPMLFAGVRLDVLPGRMFADAPMLPAGPVSMSTGDYSYIVGAGDNINIIVLRNLELSVSAPVDKWRERPRRSRGCSLAGRDLQS